VTIPVDEAAVEALLPPVQLDGSGIGINHADAVLKAFRQTLPDGRKLVAKRRGLKITVAVGEAKGEGLMRRLAHGPDEKRIFREALAESAAGLGGTVAFAPGAVHLDLP
jgi:hypothetical protein